MNKIFSIVILIAITAFIPLGFSGCGDAGGAAKGPAPVKIYVSDVSDSMFESDVCTDPADSGVCSYVQDEIDLTVKNIPLDQGDEVDTSEYMDVVITGFHVEFERTDTGTAVPKAFGGGCNYYVAIDSEVTFSITICRADMKSQPPLSYLVNFGYDPETGLDVIHTRCKITIWGKTVAGEDVIAEPVYINVDFANWVG